MLTHHKSYYHITAATFLAAAAAAAALAAAAAKTSASILSRCKIQILKNSCEFVAILFTSLVTFKFGRQALL